MCLDLFRSVDFSFRKFFEYGSFILTFIWSSLLNKRLFVSLSSIGILIFILKKFFLLGGGVHFQWKVIFFTKLLCRIFILILLCKIWGLFPLIFGITTQMVFVLFMSLILWLIINFSSLSFQPIKFFSHFSPLRSPMWLAPLLNVIEIVRRFIRPLTLCLRLSINMTTGHVFITLLGVRFLNLFFSKSSFLLLLIVTFIFSFYFLFELAIRFIQAFVFGLLTNQYLDEHS